jgi:hypothetical protein
MQQHNKLFLGAAKNPANAGVSQRHGTVPPSGRCRAPSPNHCADHDICARWPGMVPSALILPSALPTSPPSCCRCSQNHRSKICTGSVATFIVEDRWKSARRTAMRRAARRANANHVAVPARRDRQPDLRAIDRRIAADVRMRCCRQPQRRVAHVTMRWHRLRSRQRG